MRVNKTDPKNDTEVPRAYSFFEKTPQIYNIHYTKFDNTSLIFNLSKPEFKNLSNPGLTVTLEGVDYENKVNYTLNITSLILGIQTIGIIYNMVKICKDQKLADLDFPSVIIFYINSNIMLSIENSRIQETNTMFDFLSFGSYYAKCLLIGLYVAIIRARIRQGEEEISKLSMILILCLCVSFGWVYYFALEIDGLFYFSSLLLIAFQCYNSYKKAELNFSIGYTFMFKFSQFLQILFLANLKPPYTLVPDAGHITRPSIMATAFIYTIVFAQIVYHPKLFMRWKHLKAEMKFRPVKRRVGELPERDNGYSCIVCMDDFGEESDEGVWTNCGHFFHEKCLEDWLKIRKKCPICKSKCLSMDFRND